MGDLVRKIREKSTWNYLVFTLFCQLPRNTMAVAFYFSNQCFSETIFCGTNMALLFLLRKIQEVLGSSHPLQGGQGINARSTKYVWRKRVDEYPERIFLLVLHLETIWVDDEEKTIAFARFSFLFPRLCQVQ